MSLYDELQEPEFYGQPYYLSEGVYLYPPERSPGKKSCWVEAKRGNTTLESNMGAIGMANLAFEMMDEAKEARRDMMILWEVIEKLAESGYKDEDVIDRVLKAAKRNAKKETLLKLIREGEDFTNENN